MTTESALPKNDLFLDGANIIVTRPKGQSNALIEAIQRHGGHAFEVPALEIVETRHKKQALEKLNRAKDFDYLLFTSPNAVKFAEKLGLDFSSIQGFIAIGSGTEAKLAPFIQGKEIITAPKPYTSEALIQKCKEHDLKGRSILIISGEGGRRLLGNALKKQGARTQYCNVYRREVPQHFPLDSAIEAKKHKKRLALLISSQEALNNLLPPLKEADLLSAIDPLIVGSKRLANHAKKLGFQNPIIAKSALEADMWDTLIQTLGQRDPSSPAEHTTDILKTSNEEHSMSKHEDQHKEPRKNEAASSNNEQTQTNKRSKKVADERAEKPSSNTAKSTKVKADSPNKNNEKSKKTSNATQSEELTATTKPNTPPKADAKKESGEPKAPTAKRSQTAPAPEVTKKSGNGVAWLALLVALAGSGAGGYLYYDSLQNSPQKALATLEASKSADSKELASLKAELSDLQKAVEKATQNSSSSAQFDASELESRVAYLAKSYNDTNTSLDNSARALQQQIDKLLENQVALTQKSEQITVAAKRAEEAYELARNFDTRIAEQGLMQDVVLDEAKSLINTIKNATDLELLRLTEIDYLLKVAVHKVRFDKDFEMAKSALDSALQRLELVKSINFGETKRLIAENIHALSQLKPVDLMAVTERLERISRVVQQAPLKEDSALLNLKKELFGQQEQGGENWKEKLKGSLKGLVVIENHRTDLPELMAKEDRFFLNQNIQLELTAAKVALMRDQFEIFSHSIATVKNWIETYFDEDHSDVREAIKHLQWLLDADMELELPNVQRTLTDFEATLRAYRGEL